MQRWVMHLDMDAFYAAAAQRVRLLAGEAAQTARAARVAGSVVTLKVR